MPDWKLFDHSEKMCCQVILFRLDTWAHLGEFRRLRYVFKSYQMRLQTEHFSVSSTTARLESNASNLTYYSVFQVSESITAHV